jgi:hypothetical protein
MQYDTKDQSLDRDAHRAEELLEKAGGTFLKTGAELYKAFRKPKPKDQVKIKMTSGPSKDIENVREALKQGASEKQAKNIVRNGEFVQGQNKGPGFNLRARRYESMIIKKAQQANTKELVEQKFGADIWEQAKPKEAQSQSQSHDLGL